MISIALAFLGGVLALLQLKTLPNGLFGWLFVPLLVVLLVCRRQEIRVIAAGLLGFCWCLMVSHHVMSTGLATELIGQDVIVTGQVKNFPLHKGLVTSFLLDVDQLRFHNKDYPSPGRIRLSWYHAPVTPQIGEHWRFRVRLKPPHGFMNPGGFDYETSLFARRIRATGYVRRGLTPRRVAVASGLSRWQSLRYRLQQKIYHLSGDSPMAGFLAALAMGAKNGISAAQWDVLRRTGTAHLMAISGLHIGLLASLGYVLGGWCWRRRSAGLKRLPAQKVAALTAIVFAFTYAALAGFSIPTQRALVMVCVAMLAMLRQRFVQPAQVLAQALLLVLFIDPLSVLSAGFWLSFTAVAIILYGVTGRLERVSKWRSMLKMQWLLLLGLLPLTVGLFQQASLVAPLTNLIAIPVVGFLVVPLTLLACAMMVYEPVASSLLHLAAGLMHVLWQGLVMAASWAPSQLHLAASPLVIGLTMLGVILLLSPRGIPAKSLGIIFCLPLFFPVLSRPQQGHVWLSLLDVGQGLSVVVQTRRHTLVYDTGPKFSDTFDTGEAVVAPFLRHAGTTKLDMLVVSHADNDHIGGAASLLSRYPAEQILSSVPNRLSARANLCQRGQHWQWDGVSFEVLHPSAHYEPRHHRRNNRCCVLRIQSVNGSVLLPGDIEKEAEHRIVASKQRLQADVLVVPHHGSKTSSSLAFIQSVDPKLALLPVGYRNRYHLPNQHVLTRYVKRAIPAFATADSGCLLVRFDKPHKPHVVRYRQQAAHFWHHRVP